LLIGWAVLPARGALALESQAMQIDADYPGGNIVVEQIEDKTVVLRPDLRDTKGWWFYWNFRVRNADEGTWTFKFAGPNPMGVRGPAVSTDQGASWSWLGKQRVEGSSFSYAFTPEQDEIRFSFAIPYLESNLDQFRDRHRDKPCLAVKELCKSRKGRTIERIHVGPTDHEPAHRVLLTSRHHACESMGSYAVEGFLDAVLDDTEDGRWFRETVEVMAIPLVDKDGVQDGDQGKNRIPHDHNRDYLGDSIYPSVDAIRALVPVWSEGRLKAAFDLHCPWIRGAHNEVIYIVGSSDPENWKQQMMFGRILQAACQGPLPYRAADNLPFGQAWNTGSNYQDGMSCSMWTSQLQGIHLGTSFEIPYANAAGAVVDAESARAFGRDLAVAVRQYLTGL
jgi:hypothetical protein